MKLVSWNVNGLRAVLNKNFLETFRSLNADIFCLQETKCQPGQVELDLEGYHQYFHSAERKGYSSTAVFTREEPLSVSYDFEDNGDHPREGRIMTLEYEKFYLVNAYVPNSQDKLARLDYRMQWEEDMLEHLNKLNEKKPVIYCGDLNVAHQEIDIKNPAANHFNAGFSDQEREKMSELLASGYA
ncbi:MAG: exodeoxyribonuclease III, partial [Erysipelotrichaceae bacterium]|nr:exodeoxyribonuclease III [Erysipelotrichaceae bacterium]